MLTPQHNLSHLTAHDDTNKTIIKLWIVANKTTVQHDDIVNRTSNKSRFRTNQTVNKLCILTPQHNLTHLTANNDTHETIIKLWVVADKTIVQPNRVLL